MNMAFIFAAFSVLMAAAFCLVLLRIIKAKRRADEFAQVVLDTTPLCVSFLDRNLKIIDCNKKILKMFEISSRKEFIERFPDFSPEKQPDGRSSVEKAKEYVKKAIAKGSCRFGWMHQTLDGKPIPSEVVLVRIKYYDGLDLIAYTRDLRGVNTLIAQMYESNELINTLKDELDELETAAPGKQSQEEITASIQIAFEADAKNALSIFEDTLENISDASSEDLRLFTIKANSLKNDLKNMGERETSKMAAVLEKAGKEQNKNVIAKETHNFIKALKSIIAKIGVKTDSKTIENGDPAYLQEQLWIISRACAGYDEKTATSALASLQKMAWAKETKDVLDKIAEHLLHSNFEEAEAMAKKYSENP
jgi:biopolymer transport protein ExbB/TolQ